MPPQVGCARLEAGELRNFAVPKAFSEGGERVLANDKRDPYAVDEKALSDLDKRIRSARKSTKDPRNQPDDDADARRSSRSEEHTSDLQSRRNLVCPLPPVIKKLVLHDLY